MERRVDSARPLQVFIIYYSKERIHYSDVRLNDEAE